MKIVNISRLFASFLVLAASGTFAPAASTQVRSSHSQISRCRIAVLDGEVEKGQEFRHAIGNGLEIYLQPFPSGWRLRIVPQGEPAAEHDYAEVATPPYHSVTPLLIGTDFGFRSQDALAWNPRRFRFTADRSSFTELLGAYAQNEAYETLGSRTESQRIAHQASKSILVALAARAVTAEFTIVDARLLQGTGDQSPIAATVALHLNASVHKLDQAADGKTTTLGQLNWIRFRLRFSLPQKFKAASGVALARGGCL